MSLNTSVIRDIVRTLREKGFISVEALSRETGLPPDAVERVLAYLIKRGILVEEKCSLKCQTCFLRPICGEHNLGLKIYRLREKEFKES